MNWQPGDTAPHDKVIIADTGLPWPVMAVWNEYLDKWAITELQHSICDGSDDPVWVTEYEDELIAWAEFPTMPFPAVLK